MEGVTLKTMKRQTRRAQHTVKCPACHRKLCNLSLEGQTAPLAEIQDAGSKYDLELRCASCKVFVGVTFR